MTRLDKQHLVTIFHYELTCAAGADLPRGVQNNVTCTYKIMAWAFITKDGPRLCGYNKNFFYPSVTWSHTSSNQTSGNFLELNAWYWWLNIMTHNDDTEDQGDKFREMSNNAHHAWDPPWLDLKPVVFLIFDYNFQVNSFCYYFRLMWFWKWFYLYTFRDGRPWLL